MNKVFLMGRLGASPEIRYTLDGKPVCIFNIATNEYYTREDGQRQEITEWHRIVAFGKLAETLGMYLDKGSKVFVEGKIRSRQIQDKTTGNVRKVYEILAYQVVFLDKKEDKQEVAIGGFEEVYESSIKDDDIPF